MDDVHKKRYLEERYTSDELMEELDRRLESQGIDLSRGSVKILMDYLRDGWTMLAFPKDIVDQYDIRPADGVTLHQLAANLRAKLAEMEGSDGR